MAAAVLFGHIRKLRKFGKNILSLVYLHEGDSFVKFATQKGRALKMRESDNDFVFGDLMILAMAGIAAWCLIFLSGIF